MIRMLWHTALRGMSGTIRRVISRYAQLAQLLNRALAANDVASHGLNVAPKNIR
jgi:hypothetical protein